MRKGTKSIVILGGGTAGWNAANLMASYWEETGIDITLVESPDIGIIGVGEGSTPPLKRFFDIIGARESDWMPQCDATYKVGITFRHWSTKPGYDEYFHPFQCQPDEITVPAFYHNSFLRRKGVDLNGHPSQFFIGWYLANQRRAPITPRNFPFKMNYGYHFNSGLLGKFLQDWALKKGVKYRQATVSDVELADEGYIDYLKTDSEETIKADFYVDSTGFRSQLLQRALGVPFESRVVVLFNDSAVVFPSEPDENPEPQTISTALKYGWAWKIPLTSRFGNGYVYSSKYVDDDAAELEFRQHLGIADSDIEARRLRFRVGRVKEHWVKNCLAVGLSQGFIEPLEATALDMVQETVYRFVEAVNKGDRSDQYRDEFNARITKRFDAIRDYIVCHYRINTRSDTEYWLDNGRNEKISMSLRELLTAWISGHNITQEIERQNLDAYFPSMSWNCLLAGKGIYPTNEQVRPGNELAHKYDLEEIKWFLEGCALNFKPHVEQLQALREAEAA
ncbi:MAG: tryptophan 7-halogenase [Woeseiaceae bacterium]